MKITVEVTRDDQGIISVYTVRPEQGPSRSLMATYPVDVDPEDLAQEIGDEVVLQFKREEEDE